LQFKLSVFCADDLCGIKPISTRTSFPFFPDLRYILGFSSPQRIAF
jgi:hypothetical protein